MYFKRWKQFNEGVAVATPDIKNKINDWNTKYAQQFKFINDKPDKSQMTSIKDINGLGAVILPSYLDKVKEAISEFVELCKDNVFHDFIKTTKLVITGHTSTKAPTEYNEKLSIRRATIINNVIKNELVKAGIKDLEFIIIGKGETEPIIINDYPVTAIPREAEKNQWKAPVKFASNATTVNLPPNPSSESRMAINRRITILLPNMTEPKQEIPIIADKPVEDVVNFINNDLSVELDFHVNSGLLKIDSQDKLISLCNDINNSKENITELYIYLTVQRGKEQDGINVSSDEKTRDNFLDILSVNRSVLVRKIIKSKLKNSSIKIYTYPASFMVNRRYCLVSTKKTSMIDKAKTRFDEIAKKHSSIKVSGKGDLDDSQPIIENLYFDTIAKTNIENVITNNNFDSVDKFYPLELFYDDDKDGLIGFDEYKDIRNKYKPIYKKLIRVFNRKYNRKKDYKLQDFLANAN